MQRWLRAGLILVVAGLVAPDPVQGRRMTALCTVEPNNYTHLVYPYSREFAPGVVYPVQPSFPSTYTSSAVDCWMHGIAAVYQSQLEDVCEANPELTSVAQIFSEALMVWDGQFIFENPIEIEGNCQ